MLFNNPINYANIISGTIAAVVGLLILLKNKKEVLNQFFFLSLLVWGISYGFNALTFLYVDPDTIGVEILRDITTGAGSIGSFLIFMTALVMLKGSHFLSKWYVMVPIIIVMMTNTIVGCLYDHVVFDDEMGIGIKTTQAPWVMIFVYVIPILMIIFATGIFIKIRYDSSDILVKRRILYFILGFTFIVLGSLTYALGGIIEQIVGILNVYIEYTIWILAEIFWTTSPILLLVGFHVKRPSEKEDLSANI